MENENTSADLEALTNQLGEMSKEELVEQAAKFAKAKADQEKYNKILKEENKSLKSQAPEEEVVEATPSEEAPKEEKKPEEEPITTATLEDVRLAQQGLTDSEIDMVKRYAKAFDLPVAEAVHSTGFKAQLEERREKTQSADISIEDLSGLNNFTNDDEFMQAVGEGRISLQDPTHARRFQKIKVKEMKH